MATAAIDIVASWGYIDGAITLILGAQALVFAFSFLALRQLRRRRRMAVGGARTPASGSPQGPA